MAVAPIIKQTPNGYNHYCVACQQVHTVPKGWSFNGNMLQPSFNPSVLITYNGSDAGQIRPNGVRAPQTRCHYYITAGNIIYQTDCSHAFAGKTVPLETWLGA
jgi:hypothetical protein